MKQIMLLLAAAVLIGGTMFAQEKLGTPAKVKEAAVKVEKANMWHGYVVDAMCAKGMAKKGGDAAMKAAANHTRECALNEECAASGFGIFTDGKYVKFDEAGDKQALDMLQHTKTEKNIMVMVNGEMKDDKLAVTSLMEHAMDKSMDSKMKEKGMEKMKKSMEMKPAEKSGK